MYYGIFHGTFSIIGAILTLQMIQLSFKEFKELGQGYLIIKMLITFLEVNSV